jgi:hypothetical protein
MRNSQRNQELSRKAQELTLETRQTQIFMRIYEQLNSEESNKTFMELMYLDIEDNEEYLRKYDSHVNIAHYAKRAHIWYSYNTIGELLRMGIIDSDLVHRLGLDAQVTLMWEKWGNIIRQTRVREKLPDIWEGFEYLYNEMKEYRRLKGYPDDPEVTPRDYIS